MPDKNGKFKRSNDIISNRPIKRNNNNNSSSDINQQEPQWVDLRLNKTSRVWKHFGVKTDRFKVLKNGVEEECNYSCVYNTQISTLQHHLNAMVLEIYTQQ